MFFSDLRVAVFVVYAVLVTWRISLGTPEGYWPYTLAFAVLMAITRALEGAVEKHRLERDVAYLTSLDPAVARQRIDRLWSAHARRTYRELLSEEGAVEQTGLVERFPYARSERRSVDQLFWVCIAVAAVAFALLFTVARRGSWTPWALWVAGSVSVGGASWARRRVTELASTLELTPFGIAVITSDGGRSSVRWRHAAVLQNQPRRRRVLLSSVDGATIPLGYRRVGFERLLGLTIAYGGFAPPQASSPEAATPPQPDPEPR